ncbi:MAG: hypothetical protein QNL04_05370 [SAR324 cluster bacterium]|nr:hypothetical protein [SAR324 cluster bacterium]
MTMQTPELLFYQEKTYPLLVFPLVFLEKQWPKQARSILKNSLVNDFFCSTRVTTNCYRGYKGIWEIQKKHLYLRTILDPTDINVPHTEISNIYDRGEENVPPEKNLQKVTMTNFIKDFRVTHCYWFTGFLICGLGDYSARSTILPSFEKYMIIPIIRGTVGISFQVDKEEVSLYESSNKEALIHLFVDPMFCGDE